MRIDFTEEGGIAYMPGLRRPATIDGGRLDAGESERFQRLITTARFFDLPESIGTPAAGAADYQHYRLTIEDGGRSHTVRMLVPVADAALRDLVAAVQDVLRAQRAAQRAAAPKPG